VRFILFTAKYVQQQYTEHTVAFPWQSVQHLLHYWQRHYVAQQYTENSPLRYHGNNGHENAPRRYVTSTLLISLMLCVNSYSLLVSALEGELFRLQRRLKVY